ncbi:MAG TPA: hypothetical protein DCM10_08290 [Xanthomarina gelatinilytica]|nr:hypothetical protein [Xanthomarina gelatinilytica]
MDYKREEIEEYFYDFLKENKEYLREEKGLSNWTEDLHHNCFTDTDYYIIGTYQAKQWLGDEAFTVINYIKDYEMDNFGEVYTDLADPEKVVNMYTYIIGEQIVYEYLDKNTISMGEKFNHQEVYCF